MMGLSMGAVKVDVVSHLSIQVQNSSEAVVVLMEWGVVPSGGWPYLGFKFNLVPRCFFRIYQDVDSRPVVHASHSVLLLTTTVSTLMSRHKYTA